MSSHVRVMMDIKSKNPLTWLLLPGGPGMGSESLIDLIPCLHGLGSVGRIDLPDDGSNRIGLPITLNRWQNAVLEVCQSHENIILVGHSFGGMLLQTLPEIEPYIQGLVLMNTTPDNGWFTSFGARAKAKGLPNVSTFRKALLEHPSDEAYANYMLHSLNYYFTSKSYVQGLKLFQSLPFNHQAYLWALTEFHPVYKAHFVPQVPTMILGGELDFMTPYDVFHQPDYQRSSAHIVTVQQAAHFPWLEQCEQVTLAFNEFCKEFNL